FILAGLLGGTVASQTGSGIDLICFILMTLGYGLMERRAIPTSVIIMASMSVLGFLLHGTLLHDNSEATKFWLVSVPIVAVGAPLGAFVASHVPEQALITGILLLVVCETATTITLVMIGSRAEVWIVGLITLLVTAAWLSVLLRRRKRLFVNQ
ncbi:MAG: putative membrane protein YfcA, partial [Verrucomicrobiales bacterium]